MSTDVKPIPVYTIFVDGMRGPTEKTIQSLLADIETECDEFANYDGDPKKICIEMSRMAEAEYDALPEFQGY